MTGEYRGCYVKLFDYSHTAAPDYYVEHRHTAIILRPAAMDAGVLPNLAIAPGSYLERYLIAEYAEVELSALDPAIADHYRAYADDPQRAHALMVASLAPQLLRHPGFYLEIRNNAVLAFRPDKPLESPAELATLLAFADWLSGALARTHAHAAP